MRKWSPKTTTDWRDCPRKDDGSRCADCGRRSIKIRCIITEQTSVMRGDDKLTELCIPCALKRGIVPSNPVCKLLFERMTPGEVEAIAERLR